MPNIVGVRFKSCGKIYDFEINGIEVRKGDRVIIESEFGLSIGNIALAPHFVEKPSKPLKKVLRLVTEQDLRQKQDNENFEKEAKGFCYERIMARGLPMKLICAEVSLDRKRIVFYFTADGRIDFRELVKDLAAKFKTRIEMRQIGVRDKAKLVGGLGICGKELCCRLFLTSFEPISIKMAKQQELSLNTGKLSGSCSRLMCCLGYEYSESYTADKDAGKTIADSPIDEALEVVDESFDALSPDISSRPPDQKTGGALLSEEKRDEQKPAQADTHKRKRRRRRRKRFPKKEVS